MFGLLEGAAQAGGGVYLVGGLGEQLAPVGQHQHPLAGADAVLGDGGEHHRLAGAGGQHQQGAAAPGVPFGVYGPPGLGLIGAQLHVQKAPFCQDSCCAAGAAGAAGRTTGGRNLTILLAVPVSPAWGPLFLV